MVIGLWLILMVELEIEIVNYIEVLLNFEIDLNEGGIFSERV